MPAVNHSDCDLSTIEPTEYYLGTSSNRWWAGHPPAPENEILEMIFASVMHASCINFLVISGPPKMHWSRLDGGHR